MSELRDRDRDCSVGNSLEPDVESSLAEVLGRRTDCGGRSVEAALMPKESAADFAEKFRAPRFCNDLERTLVGAGVGSLRPDVGVRRSVDERSDERWADASPEGSKPVRAERGIDSCA